MDNPWAEPEPEPEPDDWTAPSWSPSEPEPRPEVPQTVYDTSSEQQTVWLHSLLHHCHQVSHELWPEPESGTEGDWRSGFDNLVDIAGLLAKLVPSDTPLLPTIHFSETATAKAMNEALKLTRHLPMSADSPLSRLLASKGSLDREIFIKAKPDFVSDSTVHVGWRVLGKEDRLDTAEESKPKKATGSFLSFWSRRTSAIQPAPVETPRERSPVRSSLESVKSPPHPSPSRAASPTKPSTASVSPLPSTDSYPTGAAALAPSAVSRFLNRFSRSKGTQHSALALSSDDLEFLSDIVPSACDPPDEDINQNTLVMLTGASNSSPPPAKLPPPIPPPLKQTVSSSRTSSVHVLGSPASASVIASTPKSPQTQDANNVPLLAPPLSPKPVAHTQSSSSVQDVVTPAIVFGQPSTSRQQRLQFHPIPQPQPLSLSPVQKDPPLPFPLLLPPPPVSPQTPRPGVFSFTTSARSPTLDSSALTCDPDGSDDEFSAFTSFPAPAPASFLSSESYPLRPPSPPSPPPRRTYERTHYPSSSSTSSILSPASHSSADQLCSNRTSVTVSLDGFDDFISSPSAARQENRKHTPSPPPLPAKTLSQERRLPRIDTRPSRIRHSHTPSHTFASPTVHTSLMTNISPPPSVSNTEHQRTQALVNHAAARGGLLWPNSPKLGEPQVSKILPPMAGDSFDLLGDGTLGDGLETSFKLLDEVGNLGIDSVSALFGPSNVAGVPGQHPGSGKPQLPPPSSFSMSPTTTMASFLGAPHIPAALNVGSLPPTKPRQTGGLSAQDLSFFEGL